MWKLFFLFLNETNISQLKMTYVMVLLKIQYSYTYWLNTVMFFLFISKINLEFQTF